MGLLARGTAFLNRSLAAAGGVAVSYARKGGPTATLTAVPGDPRAESEQTTPPARLSWTERDYLIEVADWIAAGLTGVPAEGDRITETINGAARVYEVMRRDTEPAWRYSDAAQSVFRVHTKPRG